MKKTNVLILVLLVVTLASCKKPKKPAEPTEVQHGILVLNEGTWGGNNASITYYDFDGASTSNNAFYEKNGRYLGELGNDIAQYGGKLYILVGGSSQIEVTDLSLNSIRQIGLFDGQTARQPQSITFHGNKAYITCFDGHVCKLDTASLVIDGFVQVGKNPVGLCVSHNKLYVANSGGLDWPVYDSTVSVVDLNTFTEIKKITVAMNPNSMGVDERGYVYVCCKGNYDDVPYSFHQIDPNTDTYVTSYADAHPSDFYINKNEAYIYGLDYSTSESTYTIINLINGAVINSNFKGNVSITAAYNLVYNNETQEVYISDAKDYTGSGLVTAIKNGSEVFNFTTGIAPKKMIVLKK